MEEKDSTSTTEQSEEAKSPEKSTEIEEKKDIVEEETKTPDATDTIETKPTQNGETEPDAPEKPEEEDITVKPVEENNTESNDKITKTPRGRKRKAVDNEKNESTSEKVETETVEQKENVDSKNDDNVQKESQPNEDVSMKSLAESHIMGKGKRARIPNKRYSDILLSPNRKSTSHPKPSNVSDSDEVAVKEEPVDLPMVSGVSSPSLPAKKIRASVPKENLQDPKYLKPFKYGWKRELVWRSTSTASKPIGDIYYYTPQGKKVRSMREVSDILTGKNLVAENFSFTKEPLGIDDPEKEIIRDAKIKSSDSFSESPAPKKVVEIKKPKKLPSPKSTVSDSPKVDTTPAKKKVEPAALKETPPAVSKKTPAKMPLRKSKTPLAKKPKLAAKTEEQPEKVATPPPTIQTRSSPSKNTSKPCQPCSITCHGLHGVVPTLQCRLCLCLYHHECVGASPNLSFPYICKNCLDQGQTTSPSSSTIVAPPPLTPINTLKSVSTPLSTTLPKLQRIPRPDSSDPVPMLQPLHNMPPLVEVPKANTCEELSTPPRTEMPKLIPKLPPLQEEPPKSLVGSVTSWLPHNVKIVNNEEPTEAPRPQYVEYLGGRKFLVIPKHNFMSVSSSSHPISRSEDLIVPATPLQPPEVPMVSASLGPTCSGTTPSDIQSNLRSTTSPNTQNPPKEPDKPSTDTPESVPEIKEEPLSPAKPEDKQPSEPMEVDLVRSDNVESSMHIKEDDESKEAEDE